MCPTNSLSFSVTSVYAVPLTPALPVLPTRWVCVSMSRATSKFITVLIWGISRPRAATSVATNDEEKWVLLSMLSQHSY